MLGIRGQYSPAFEHSPWKRAECSIEDGLTCTVDTCHPDYSIGESGDCEIQSELHLAVEIPSLQMTLERLHTIGSTLKCLAKSRFEMFTFQNENQLNTK